VYLSLGSNVEPRLERLNQCSQQLALISGCIVEQVSRVYESAAEDMEPETAPFLNQALRMRTELTPVKLLQETENLERRLGRVAKGQMQSRTIDIDLLLYGKQTINTNSLEIPHPRMSERAFVLIPLLELDRALKNPNTGQPYGQLCDSDMSGKVTLVTNNNSDRYADGILCDSERSVGRQ